MTITMYATCFFIALIGSALAMAFKVKSLRDKAKNFNLQFRIKEYFQEDYISFVISFLTIVLSLFLVSEGLKWKPWVIDYVKSMFACLGYMSSDIAGRIFSAVNNRLNAAISAKTTQTDIANGTVDEPTPAVKPK